MQRRRFIYSLGALALAPLAVRTRMADEPLTGGAGSGDFQLSDEVWRERLSPLEFRILRRAGTERPWTSALLREKRDGAYHCVGCDQALFRSETKYDSGTGWPSFYDVIAGAIGTRRDFKLLVPRTEYHCARCGGHHGHVFDDGPKPTGLRYCNNGAVLRFKPDNA